jgi:hypothetical protein
LPHPVLLNRLPCSAWIPGPKNKQPSGYFAAQPVTAYHFRYYICFPMLVNWKYIFTYLLTYLLYTCQTYKVNV